MLEKPNWATEVRLPPAQSKWAGAAEEKSKRLCAANLSLMFGSWTCWGGRNAPACVGGKDRWAFHETANGVDAPKKHSRPTGVETDREGEEGAGRGGLKVKGAACLLDEARRAAHSLNAEQQAVRWQKEAHLRGRIEEVFRARAKVEEVKRLGGGTEQLKRAAESQMEAIEKMNAVYDDEKSVCTEEDEPDDDDDSVYMAEGDGVTAEPTGERSMDTAARMFKAKRFGLAKAHVKHAIDQAKQAGHELLEGRAYGNLANIYETAGQSRKAIKYYKMCISKMRKLGEKGRESFVLSNAMVSCIHLKKYSEALKLAQRKLRITDDPEKRAETKGWIVKLRETIRVVQNRANAEYLVR